MHVINNNDSIFLLILTMPKEPLEFHENNSQLRSLSAINVRGVLFIEFIGRDYNCCFY